MGITASLTSMSALFRWFIASALTLSLSILLLISIVTFENLKVVDVAVVVAAA